MDNHLSVIKDHEAIIVNDSMKPMSNCLHNSQQGKWWEIKGKGDNALVISKESPNSSRIVAWILASVSKSMLLVASSKIIIDPRRRRALAKAINCLWPWEKFAPPADTAVSSVIWALLSVVTKVRIDEGESSCSRSCVEGAREVAREECCDPNAIRLRRWTRYSTSRQSLSSCSSGIPRIRARSYMDEGFLPNGSRFSRKDPENNVASFESY